MIPYSRPKLSDLYTLTQSKLLENHTLHSSTYLYSPYMAVPSRACFTVLSCGTTETEKAKERFKGLTFAPEQCESGRNLV